MMIPGVTLGYEQLSMPKKILLSRYTAWTQNAMSIPVMHTNVPHIFVWITHVKNSDAVNLQIPKKKRSNLRILIPMNPEF